MGWAMRYTFHAGYQPPAFRPQFAATVGSENVADHVRFAAEQGAAGILYPWALDRPEAEVASVKAALDETGLVTSCMLAVDSSLLFAPLWTDRSLSARATLSGAVERACKLAVDLHGQVLAALIVPDRGLPDLDRQRDDVTANLADMGRIASDHGLVIGIEPMTVIPVMFSTVASAQEIIRRVGRPDVGLIYDTGHVAMNEGALMPVFDAAFDDIVLLQFADQPGRVEPGAGELDLVAIAVEALRRGYTGLVDLEHDWRSPDWQGEIEGLARLRAFDEEVRVHAGHAVA